jgi:hypothetical protein
MELVRSSGISKGVNRERDEVLVLVMMISTSLVLTMQSVVKRKEAVMILEADGGNLPFLMVVLPKMRQGGGGGG